MHLERGTVKEVSQGRALIECDPQEECAGCAARHTCMAAQNPKKRAIWIENTIGADVGEDVMFRIEEKGVVRASLILYLFPILCLIGGIYAGAGLFREAAASAGVILDRDLAAGIGGFAGLIIAFAVMRLLSARMARNDIFRPELVGRADEENDANKPDNSQLP